MSVTCSLDTCAQASRRGANEDIVEKRARRVFHMIQLGPQEDRLTLNVLKDRTRRPPLPIDLCHTISHSSNQENISRWIKSCS